MYPHERSLVKQLKDKPFALIGVNNDRTREIIQKAQVEKNLTWRAFYDGSSGPIARRWNIAAWPTVYVIDSKGIIRHRGREVDGVIEKCLSEIGVDVEISTEYED